MANATRPIFLPSNKKGGLVETKNIVFEWFMGMSISQKMKNMRSLHNAAKKLEIYPILEISTRSDVLLGKKLSAFNLMINIGNKTVTVESAYQGSKVFEKGGPYEDLYNLSGREIKSDTRLRISGDLTGFSLMKESWPLEPKTLFYDWLYLIALMQNKELSNELFKYIGFSDIAFNPKKSISCQARSAALFVSLTNKGYLPRILHDKNLYIKTLREFEEKTGQQSLI